MEPNGGLAEATGTSYKHRVNTPTPGPAVIAGGVCNNVEAVTRNGTLDALGV